jgi:hypothetical protein
LNLNFGARTGAQGIMTEPKKPINFFKILPSFQWPGIKVGLRHGDAEEPAAIDIRQRVVDARRHSTAAFPTRKP